MSLGMICGELVLEEEETMDDAGDVGRAEDVRDFATSALVANLPEGVALLDRAWLVTA